MHSLHKELFMTTPLASGVPTGHLVCPSKSRLRVQVHADPGNGQSPFGQRILGPQVAGHGLEGAGQSSGRHIPLPC